MTALHFEATYHDGMIIVPSEYRDLMAQQIEIVVLMKPIAGEHKQDLGQDEENFIEYMIRNPKNIEDFVPLSREEIYDR